MKTENKIQTREEFIQKLKKKYNYKDDIEITPIKDEIEPTQKENIKSTKKTKPNENYKPKKSNYQKGAEYERQIGKLYEMKGYNVEYRGIKMGKKDKGIDLIATKENELILIQCKNWENSTVKQKDIRNFLGDCFTFIENNPHLKIKDIKRVFVTSNKEADYGVKKFIEENHKLVKYKIIPYIQGKSGKGE